MDTTEIYNNNLLFFKTHIQSLYNIIVNTDISDISLTISQNTGDINILQNNIPVFPQKSSEYLGYKIESFVKDPNAFYKIAALHKSNPRVSPVADSYIEKVEKNIPQKSDRERAYHTHLDSLPVLLMFGIGTGQQIEHIINNYDLKTLIIIDQDFKMFKASMYLTDWKMIVSYFSRDGYTLEFKTGPNPKPLALDILGWLFRSKLQYSNFINYFITHEQPYIQEVFDQLKNNYRLLFNGWGFYDDEMVSLEHTIANINDNRKIYLGDNPVPKNSNVFIIGSGPSVDNDIKYIKKHRDNAVIVSCGTSLRILEANRIKPDYHFESERPKFQYDNLADNVSKEFMKQIDFIGVNVVCPKLLSLFKSAKIFFRENDCGASLTNESIPKLLHCNPTVVNAALSFTSNIGFENIYLFGTDMGFKDESSHHSKYSSYYDKKSNISKIKLHKTLDNKRYKGNFTNEEIFLSNEVLIWCKQRAENCIIDYKSRQKNINYYNCSDGIIIEGAKPVRSKDIKIDKKLPKQTIIEAVEKNFNNKNFLEEINSSYKDEKVFANKVINEIKESIILNHITSYSQFFSLMDKITSLIIQNRNNNKSSILNSLLSGTINSLFSTIYTHALLAKKKEESFKFINYGFSVIIEFLDNVTGYIEKNAALMKKQD